MGAFEVNRGAMRSAIWGALIALFSGCAGLPEVNPLLADPRVSKTPEISGARSILSKEQSQAVLARLSSSGKESDALERHIILEEAVTGSPLVAGNDVALLNDGPTAYNAMFGAIENAKDHVNLEFFIIEDDEVGQRLSDLLIKKRRQGVQVNLIYDSVGSINTPKAFFDRLREGGVQVLEFNPVNPLDMKKIKVWEINQRDHRKILVVDGKVAYTGGINISGVYSRGSSGGAASGREKSDPKKDRDGPGWRDTHLEVRGPAAAEFQNLFLDTWQKQNNNPLPARNYFPRLEAKGKHLVRVVGSSPDHPVPTIYVTFVSAISNAEKSVHITMAYFVPDRQTLDALKEAARRGVDVTLILPSYSDFWAVFHAGRAHYAELLDAGVRIYERQEALLHSKTMVVDGVWSTVGSSNLDWRSFLHNDEVNAVVLGRDFGKEMEAAFERDLAKSVRIEPEAWARRSLLDRAKEWASQVWQYWL
jgi:cardiolipin synthase A/B